MKKLLIILLAFAAIMACEERELIEVDYPYPLYPAPPENPVDTIDTTVVVDPVMKCYLADSTAHQLQGFFVDAAYDTVHKRLVIAVENPDKIYIYQADQDEFDEINLPEKPLSLAILPMGTAMAIGAKDNIYHYNLNTLVLRNTVPINRQARSIVFSNFLWAYHSDGYRISSTNINSKNTVELNSDHSTDLFMDANQSSIYLPFYNRVQRFSINQGSSASNPRIFNLPNHTNDRNFFQSYNRKLMMGESGHLYRLEPSANQDLEYLGVLNNVSQDIAWYSHDGNANLHFLVKESNTGSYNDTIISIHLGLQLFKDVRVPKLKLNENCYNAYPLAAFCQPGQNRLLVISRAHLMGAQQKLVLQKIKL